MPDQDEQRVVGSGPDKRDPDEAILTALFAELLGVPADDIDPQESFFRLAGDSIAVLRLVSRAQQLGLPIGVEDVFEARTVRGIAEAVKRRREDSSIEPSPGSSSPVVLELDETELAELESDLRRDMS